MASKDEIIQIIKDSPLTDKEQQDIIAFLITMSLAQAMFGAGMDMMADLDATQQDSDDLDDPLCGHTQPVASKPGWVWLCVRSSHGPDEPHQLRKTKAVTT